MSENKITIMGIGVLVWSILWGVIAYFVYGNSIDMGLVVFLLNFVYSLLSILSIIPIIGVPLYLVCMQSVYIWVVNLTGLTTSWVTYWIWGINTLGAVIINVIVTIVLLIALFKD